MQKVFIWQAWELNSNLVVCAFSKHSSAGKFARFENITQRLLILYVWLSYFIGSKFNS
jgi:hypothetical protein